MHVRHLGLLFSFPWEVANYISTSLCLAGLPYLYRWKRGHQQWKNRLRSYCSIMSLEWQKLAIKRPVSSFYLPAGCCHPFPSDCWPACTDVWIILTVSINSTAYILGFQCLDVSSRYCVNEILIETTDVLSDGYWLAFLRTITIVHKQQRRKCSRFCVNTRHVA